APSLQLLQCPPRVFKDLAIDELQIAVSRQERDHPWNAIHKEPCIVLAVTECFVGCGKVALSLTMLGNVRRGTDVLDQSTGFVRDWVACRVLISDAAVGKHQPVGATIVGPSGDGLFYLRSNVSAIVRMNTIYPECRSRSVLTGLNVVHSLSLA